MAKRGAILGTVVLAAGVVAGLVLLVSGGSPHHAPRQRPAVVGARRPPPVAEPVGEQFGASVNGLFLTPGAYSPDQISGALRALRASGATVARCDALWEATEPAPPAGGVHRYDWSFDDRIAGALAAQRLRWLAILDYSPLWAASVPGQEHSPPANSGDYAAYAAAFAARYGTGGSFWRAHPELPAAPVQTVEVWNEPDNVEFWQPAFDPARYAALYLAARTAVKAVDPSMHVLVGGLSYAPMTIPRLLAAVPALRGHVDGVAVHPYAADPRGVLQTVTRTRAVLDRLGLESVPLYLTEFGWTTRPPGAVNFVPARARPLWIATALSVLGHTNCGIAATLLYTWVTPERNPLDRQDWYGIYHLRGGGSADVGGFATGVRDGMAPGATHAVCGAG